MSKPIKTTINGMSGTFLMKEKYPTFDECVNLHSFRMEESDRHRYLVIHKYIPLKYLLVLLKEKKLIMNPVSSWEDPYENFFLKQRFTKPEWDNGGPYTSIEEMARGIFGMSWTLQDENDSLWRIYSPDKMSVRISISVEELVKTICSEDDKWDVWMNTVMYKTDKGIKMWLQGCKGIKYKDEFIDKISESFFIKRKAFSAEKEFRIVVHYEKEIRPMVCFRFKPELISSFTLDPRLSEYEYEAAKGGLMAFGVDDHKILKSRLYDFKPQKVKMEYDPFEDF